jgi:hypothetical protein
VEREFISSLKTCGIERATAAADIAATTPRISLGIAFLAKGKILSKIGSVPVGLLKCP